MGKIIERVEGRDAVATACPYCRQEVTPDRHCRHVRWTFAQGGPLDFARYCVEHSPYITGVGHKPSEIPRMWWADNGDWLVEEIATRFHVGDGLVFGEIGTVDIVARDIWKRFRPEDERPRGA